MGLIDVLKYRLPLTKVDLPGFAAPVYMRQLTAQQSEDYANQTKGAEDNDGKTWQRAALLVSMCLCDANGDLLCQQDGVNQCMQLGTEALERLAREAVNANAMGTETPAKN